MNDHNSPTAPTTLDAGGHVAVDLACVSCRYNLRTLPVDGKCPECGHPVTETTAGYLPILDCDGRVADDLPCVNCGYNLRTLVATGICPECAAQVALSVRGHYLHRAPPRWVKRLAGGALLLIVAIAVAIALGVVMIVTGIIIGTVVGQVPPGLEDALLILSCVFGAGVVSLIVIGLTHLTAPDPVSTFREGGLTARRLVRWCALALPVL
ncbi:MAG: hypothetical protein KKI02_10025, partial [Planctomycetes bacterium]|nr:hypothetical protein [Planctomycetota bacterium]